MFDVVIAGAGPNGLMLACELALAGVRPVVLERLTGPATEQRANGLVGQVVRMLDRRGLFERLAGAGAVPQPAPGFVFGAFPLRLSDLPDNPLYTLPVPQRQIEEMLADRAAELSVAVRRGCEVVGLSQDDDSVHVTLADGETLRTRWLVGADGGRSMVRRLAGIGFPGVTTDTSVSRTGTVGVPASAIDPATGGLVLPGYGIVPPFQHTRTETGLIAWAPFPGREPGLTTVEWPESTDFDAEMTLDELRASAHRVMGVAVPLEEPAGPGPHLMRRLTGGNTRLAERYRAGRVLLIGDAAHVHSAIGGPGLNLGLQDAVNLGWKLAAVVQGWGPDGLLDTFEAERRPAAERVTMSTQAQSALIAPGGDITALRILFAELLARPENTEHIAALLAGSDVGYARWAPDLLLDTAQGPRRLAELTAAGRPLLIDSTGTLDVAGYEDRVDVITAVPRGSNLTAALIRPDCYLAWESTSPHPDPDGLRLNLEKWFGVSRLVTQ